MNRELNNHLNRLAHLIETARDRQRSEEARRVWRAARECLDSLRSTHGPGNGLGRIGALNAATVQIGIAAVRSVEAAVEGIRAEVLHAVEAGEILGAIMIAG